MLPAIDADVGELSEDDYAYEDELDEIKDGFSLRLGAARTWLIGKTDGIGAINELRIKQGVRLVRVLGGRPIRCLNLRQAAGDARDRKEILVADNTLPSSFGCAAARLGAHLTFEELDHIVQKPGSGLLAVSVSHDALRYVTDLRRKLKEFRKPTPSELADLRRGLEDFDARRRAAFDCAQVAAYYLSCHPKVSHVYYPGLPNDPSFNVAAGILKNGFGSCVDFLLNFSNEDGSDYVLGAAKEEFEGYVPGGRGAELSMLSRVDVDPDTALMRLRCGVPDPDTRSFLSKLEGILAKA